MDVRDADKEMQNSTDPTARRASVEKRRAGMNSIDQFHSAGKPIFAKYMRFSQTIPLSLRLFGRT
jgi:hypothetical protein